MTGKCAHGGGITRIPALACALALTAVMALAISAFGAGDPPRGTFAGKRTTVNYSGVDVAYAKAIANICDTALVGYETVYGLPMPQQVTVRVRLGPDCNLSLWTDGDAGIYLDLHSKVDLMPPVLSGAFNIYGLCHELGHIAMYRRMTNVAGLPEGVAEGWPYYTGAIICGYVWDRLGEKAWPKPHNYYRYGGPERLKSQVTNPQTVAADPVVRAGAVFYQLDQRYGQPALGKAMDAVLATNPTGADLMKLLRDEMVKVTGDAAAADLFAPEVLERRTTFDGDPPDLTSLNGFRGLQATADATGLTLSYDDDSMETKRSIAGAGHIVQFRAPAGTWRVDAVSLFGSRYGETKPPREDFSIFICDPQMNAVAEIRKPYSLFERGPEKWVTMTFDPVTVPSGFHICVAFDPTASKGIYVAADQHAPGHSRVGVPKSRISELRSDFDWMIRVHVVPEGSVNLQKTAEEWGKTLAAPGP